MNERRQIKFFLGTYVMCLQSTGFEVDVMV